MRKRSSVRKKNKTLKKNVDYCKKTSSICVHSMKVTEKYLVHFEEGGKLSELISFRLTWRLFNTGRNLVKIFFDFIYF